MPVLRYKCHDSGRDATAEASRAVETCSCVREPPATFPCQPRCRHEKRARPPGPGRKRHARGRDDRLQGG